MRTRVGAGVLVAVAALYWARSTDGQAQSVPGPAAGSSPFRERSTFADSRR
jgi:hypothetical protein